jgi:hypothetical protein
MVPSRLVRVGLNMFVDEDLDYISSRDDDDSFIDFRPLRSMAAKKLSKRTLLLRLSLKDDEAEQHVEDE